MIQDDGHVLDITSADGSWLAIYMFDGQGSVLIDPTGLLDQDRTDCLGILTALAPIAGDNPDPSWTRTVGPVKICAASAPAEVLEALANYAAGGGRNGRRFADSIIKARNSQELMQADIQTAESAADLTAEQRQIVDRLVVIKPEMWNMVIDVYQPGQQVPSTRYGGRWQAEKPRATDRKRT